MRPVLAILTAALISCGQVQAADTMSPEAKSYLEAALRIMQENFLHKDTVDWERLRREAIAHAEGALSSVETYAAIRFAFGQLGDHHSFLQLTPALAREEKSRTVKGGNAAPAATQGTSSSAQAATRAAVVSGKTGSAQAATRAAVVSGKTGRKPSLFQGRRAPEGSSIEMAPRSVAQIAAARIAVARIVVPLFVGQDGDGFATELQTIVADLVSRGPCGWIVDLR